MFAALLTALTILRTAEAAAIQPALQPVLKPLLKPVIFSSGMYNTMPNWMYTDLLSDIKQNRTIVDTRGAPLTKRHFEELCDEQGFEKLPLICHSSFDPSVLQSFRVDKVLLIDPATMPAISLTGLVPMTITPRASVQIVRSAMYASFVKAAFQPNIIGASVLQHDIGGHSDILDGMWPSVASAIGIPSDQAHRDEFKSFVSTYISKWI